MTSPELQYLYTSVMRIINVFWVLAGLVVGTAILFLIQAFREGREVKREENIRNIAHRLWEEEGCPDGHDIEHWTKAEQIWQEQRRRQHFRRHT